MNDTPCDDYKMSDRSLALVVAVVVGILTMGLFNQLGHAGDWTSPAKYLEAKGFFLWLIGVRSRLWASAYVYGAFSDKGCDARDGSRFRVGWAPHLVVDSRSGVPAPLHTRRSMALAARDRSPDAVLRLA